MNDKNCIYCNKNNIRKRSKFCSENCRQKSKYILKTSLFCLNCGLKSSKLSNYCSDVCYRKHNYKKTLIENRCNYCEKYFTHNRRSKFCDAKCRNASHYWKNITNGTCSCGKKLMENLTTCVDCHNNKKQYKQLSPRPLEQQLLNSAKARAKKKNLPINITIEDIIIPECCPVLGMQLSRGVGKAQSNSPSLDRIIPELGYVKNNIKIISHKANTIKNNSTIEEIKLVCNYMETYNV